MSGRAEPRPGGEPGGMREEIIRMCVAAIRAQGAPDVTAESIFHEPRHRAQFLELLRDCRPLPVVRALIAEAERGEAASS